MGCKPYGEVITALGSPITFGESVAAITAERNHRARKAFHKHAALLCAATPLKGRLTLHQTLVRGAALWGGQAWPVTDGILKAVNTTQLLQIRRMMHPARRAGELWEDWAVSIPLVCLLGSSSSGARLQVALLLLRRAVHRGSPCSRIRLLSHWLHRCCRSPSRGEWWLCRQGLADPPGVLLRQGLCWLQLWLWLSGLGRLGCVAGRPPRAVTWKRCLRSSWVSASGGVLVRRRRGGICCRCCSGSGWLCCRCCCVVVHLRCCCCGLVAFWSPRRCVTALGPGLCWLLFRLLRRCELQFVCMGRPQLGCRCCPLLGLMYPRFW